MTKNEIQKLLEQQEKISHKNYMAYQETGIARYMRAHEKAEDIVDLCRTALNIDNIKSEWNFCKSCLAECGYKAIELTHDNRYLDGENIGDVGRLLHTLATYGKMVGVSDPWEEHR